MVTGSGDGVWGSRWLGDGRSGGSRGCAAEGSIGSSTNPIILEPHQDSPNQSKKVIKSGGEQAMGSRRLLRNISSWSPPSANAKIVHQPDYFAF
ncbi:hypothetical protein CASFOL_042410 [Castilleja foliolosa]|uniref:Uncharacterized protein n=1 Tax=Castilleja foliolosa TaxID=1961234 RepID=A0ABD3BB62_9LAMI